MTRWTPTTITRAIRLWAQAHGRPPICDDFCTAQGMPSVNTVIRHCGSLADARTAAGCAPGRRRGQTFAAAVAAYLAQEGHPLPNLPQTPHTAADLLRERADLVSQSPAGAQVLHNQQGES